MFSALKVSPFGTVVALHHDRTELDLWNFGGGQGAKEDGVPAADDSFGAKDDLCAPDEDELV